MIRLLNIDTSFPPKVKIRVYQAGLLTRDSYEARSLPGFPVGRIMRHRLILTYSSGGCSGFAPLSLFIRNCGHLTDL